MLPEGSDESPSSIAGSLMLAHPQLKDPNFVRSVILMTAHEEEGSLGVVVNKASGLVLGEIDAAFADFGLEQVPLYIGGPVSSDQVLLAAWKSDPNFGEFQLFFGLDPASAKAKLEEDPLLSIRAFRGYAGWGEGQLESELSDNAWIVSEMDGPALSELEGDFLWRHVIMKANLELGLMSLAPDCPGEN